MSSSHHRDSRDSHRESYRDRDSQRNRDSKDSSRDSNRDSNRESTRESNRDSTRESNRDSYRDSKRESTRDPNRDSYRNSRGDRDTQRNDSRPSTQKQKLQQQQAAAIQPIIETVDPQHQQKSKIPLSAQDLVKLKQIDQSQLIKPKFLSKEERQKNALEKRQKEVETSKKIVDEARVASLNFVKAGQDSLKAARGGSGNNRRWNDRKRDQPDDNRKTAIDKPAVAETELSIDERQAIKDRYLGKEKVKRRVRKINDKKFVFDWDTNVEDTSKEINPIYQTKHQAHLFGRGTIAGIDTNQQLKDKAKFYNSLAEKHSLEDGGQQLPDKMDIVGGRISQTIFDDRHWSSKDLSEMKARDWRIFKEDFSIATKGGHIPWPLRSWKESTISPKLLEVIEKVGYTEPSPIQRQAIPIGLQNRDIIGIAETGSGKTCSFLIPMLEFILQLPPFTNETSQNGPYALILAPTRELAQQIEQETLKFCTPLGFRCVSIVGGRSQQDQAMSMQTGAEIVIATPGRLKDNIEQHIIVLSQCTYVVMDEADRMIDMGFDEDVNYILDSIPASNIKPDTEEAEINPLELKKKKLQQQPGSGSGGFIVPFFRQTVMFSATMPSTVEALARKYMRRPAVVTIGTAGQATSLLSQRVEMLPSEERKRQRLLEVLESEEFQPPLIVFVNQKRHCESISKALNGHGYNSTIFHGGKSQDQRESALRQVKEGTKDILIATDVAGRGIDIPDVSVVINYDMAKDIDRYTHRIGRTARAGKSGVAITFLTSNDEDMYFDLKTFLIKSNSNVPNGLMNHPAALRKPDFDARKKQKSMEEQMNAYQ